MRRRSAYYSRAGTYSRSYNAEVAEQEGRMPRTRAAAALGVSAPAFDAGCKAACYRCNEWHHVGKYASRVDYYDVEELRRTPAFWEGAAAHYKGAAKRAALMQAAAQARVEAAEAEARDRVEVVEQFRARLVARRDCSRHVPRHDSRRAWLTRCLRVGASVEPFDVPALLAAEAAYRDREAVALAASRRLDAILAEHFRCCGDREFAGLGLRVLIHGGGTQAAPERRVVNIYGMRRSVNLKPAAAVSLLEHRIDEFDPSGETGEER
jgi:hypothetical protein